LLESQLDVLQNEDPSMLARLRLFLGDSQTSDDGRLW
jgi:hypothetical protein